MFHLKIPTQKLDGIIIPRNYVHWYFGKTDQAKLKVM